MPTGMMPARPPLRLAGALLVPLLTGGCGDDPARPGGEGSGPPPEVVVAWIGDRAISLAGTDPDAPFSDLEPLRELVDDARVVVLGEATHGTREFLEVKHRIFRFLVREVGFDTFVLEASWPEAELVDAWVAGGEGDPRVLTSRLYRWFLNTRETLNLVEWMREENRGRPPGERLRFGGIDVQYPRLAVDTVLAFLDRTDPEAADSARARYDCFLPYVNDLDGSFDRYYGYTELPGQAKRECRRRAEAMHDDLVSARSRYLEAASAREVDRAIRSARLVVQNQHIRVNSVADQDVRDMYLAENALWELEQAGPGSRAVFSMHDFHAADEAEPWPSTARYLRSELGDDLVLVGFSVHGGTFAAFDPDADRVGTHVLPAPGPGSYEEAFHRTDLPLFLLDLDRVAGAPPEVRSWLEGPRSVRWVGSFFQEGRSYREDAFLVREFDLVLHLESGTPSTPLPFVFPPDRG